MSQRRYKLVNSHSILSSPVSISLDVGNSTDEFSDILTLLDGNIYHINEEVSAPGWTLTCTFHNQSEVRGLTARLKYEGGSTHHANIDIYNVVTSAWDTFITVTDGDDYNIRTIIVPESHNYTDENHVTIVRINHPDSGNTSHDVYIDYIGLLS